MDDILINKETIEQIKVCEWLKQCHPDMIYIHIANERHCSPVYGRILRKMGLKKGVSDLFFPQSTSSNVFKGVWLEMKVKPNKPTQSQIDFMNDMTAEGYLTSVCYSAEEAILVLRAAYGLK